MTDTNSIIQQAKERAAANGLPYAGAVTPTEANALAESGNVKIVDVRSSAELDLVGKVPGATHIEWAFYPGMVANPDFAQQLAEQVGQNDTVIFMCRTGGRSHNAAITAAAAGYANAYNMVEGFEGEANENKQRTMINGWKNAGLPWHN